MKLSWLLLVSLLSVSSLALAVIKGKVEFLAKANPGFLEIEGKGGVVDGSAAVIDKNNMISGKFLVNLNDFKTGIEQRDGHLKDYLETAKYPVAEFVLDPVSIVGGTKKAFTGSLTLHGVTKKISGTLETSSTTATANFRLEDITQYGVKVPTYKLLTVAKDVEISVTMDLK